MKKLQLFIIFYSVVLIVYTCVPEFLITTDVNSFFVDFDGSRQSVLTVSKHDIPNKIFLPSEHFGRIFTSGDIGTPKFHLDADLLEKSEIFNHGLAQIPSGYEGTPVLTAHSPALELFHFPSEAYRLRI
jgi:hypothetical protein